MNELKTTAALVKQLLEEDPQTRNSDSYLYLKVLDHIAQREGIFLAGMPVLYFLENRKRLGFPGHETVRRTRQKVQADNPELAACEKIQHERMKNELEYKAFAVSAHD